MQLKSILFLAQYLVFYNHRQNVNALVGQNVKKAVQGQFPNVVCIVQLNNPPVDLRYEIKCTGIMITRDHVLTAEHCFKNMGVGSLYILAESVDLRHARPYYITWWISYELWCISEGRTIEQNDIHDIAVIKLIEKLPESIQPALLSLDQNCNLFGLDVVLVGWGKLDNDRNPFKLRTAPVRIISNEDCEAVSQRIMEYYIPIPEKYICTIGETPTHVHSGDSGGPVIYGRFVLAVNQGTLPSPVNVGDPRKANIHFSVYVYREFIQNIMLI